MSVIELLVYLLVVALILYLIRIIWPLDQKILNVIGAILVILVLIAFLTGTTLGLRLR